VVPIEFFNDQKIEQNALPLKSIPDALNLRSQFVRVLEQAEMTDDIAERKRS
jgi:NADH dehydrogenase